MKILITGGNGDLAKYFLNYLQRQHYDVFSVSSSGKSTKEHLDFNTGFENEILSGVTHVVHCAINQKLFLTSIEKNFIEEINVRNIKMIYIGSTSSHLKSKNRYGEYKNQVEEMVLSQNGTVITCGLIHGDQIFGQIFQIKKLLGALPFGIKIIGAKKVYLTNIEKLSEQVMTIIKSHSLQYKRINCFDSDKLEFNQLLRNLSGKKMITLKLRSDRLLFFLNLIPFKSRRFDSDRFKGILSDFESTL